MIQSIILTRPTWSECTLSSTLTVSDLRATQAERATNAPFPLIQTNQIWMRRKNFSHFFHNRNFFTEGSLAIHEVARPESEENLVDSKKTFRRPLNFIEFDCWFGIQVIWIKEAFIWERFQITLRLRVSVRESQTWKIQLEKNQKQNFSKSKGFKI